MSILAKQTLIVAGTAGIGGAAALLFGQAGARVMAVGRPPGHCADLASALAAQETRVLVRSGDLADAGAAEAIVAPALERSGGIDARFHAAEISGRRMRDGPLHACTKEGFDAVLRTNLRAMFQLDRACIRQWTEVVFKRDQLLAPPRDAP